MRIYCAISIFCFGIKEVGEIVENEGCVLFILVAKKVVERKRKILFSLV